MLRVEACVKSEQRAWREGKGRRQVMLMTLYLICKELQSWRVGWGEGCLRRKIGREGGGDGHVTSGKS